MDGRHKMIVIYNGSQPIRLLDILVPLQSSFDIEILTLADEQLFSSYRLSIQVNIFENVQHMPGYLRGLEPYIQNADIVLAVGSYEVTNYQAARACSKFGVPFYLMTNPEEPFCNRFSQEELVIHGQMLKMTKSLLVFSNRAREALNIEGVNYDRIHKLLPFFSLEATFFDIDGRKRFRDHIGIEAEDKVVLLQNLNDHEQIRNILFAIRLLLQQMPEINNRFKIILVNCLSDEDYRYLICELGLSKQVLILNQKISLFEKDLYSACDVAIECAVRGTGEACDFWLLEAAKTGLVAVSIGHSAIAEHGAALGLIHLDQASNYQNLASSLEQIIMQISNGYQRVGGLAQEWRPFSANQVGVQINKLLLAEFSGQEDPLKLARKSFDHLSSTVRNLLERSEWERVDKLLKEWQAVETLTKEQKALLYCLEGDLFFSQSKFEEAMRSFEKSLKIDSTRWQALLGLARVSVISHLDEDALSFFRKAMALKPNLTAAYEGIGFIHRRNNMHEEAIYWLSQAILLEPNNSKALLQLTQACLESKEDALAIEALEQIRTTVGDHAGLIMAMGKLYMRMGKVDQGREMVDRALALSTNVEKKIPAVTA